MRISDWSSDVCSSDLCASPLQLVVGQLMPGLPVLDGSRSACEWGTDADAPAPGIFGPSNLPTLERDDYVGNFNDSYWLTNPAQPLRSEEHTSELQSLMRISYAVFCLKKKKKDNAKYKILY